MSLHKPLNLEKQTLWFLNNDYGILYEELWKTMLKFCKFRTLRNEYLKLNKISSSFIKKTLKLRMSNQPAQQKRIILILKLQCGINKDLRQNA